MDRGNALSGLLLDRWRDGGSGSEGSVWRHLFGSLRSRKFCARHWPQLCGRMIVCPTWQRADRDLGRVFIARQAQKVRRTVLGRLVVDVSSLGERVVCVQHRRVHADARELDDVAQCEWGCAGDPCRVQPQIAATVTRDEPDPVLAPLNVKLNRCDAGAGQAKVSARKRADHEHSLFVGRQCDHSSDAVGA
jgi:hypothetical protein